MKKKIGLLLMALVFSSLLCSCASQKPAGMADEISYVCDADIQFWTYDVNKFPYASMQFLGTNRAFNFSVYYFPDKKEDSYTELITVDSNESLNSLTWAYNDKETIVSSGHMVDTNGFVTLAVCRSENEEGKDQCFLQKREADGTVTETILLDSLDPMVLSYNYASRTVIVDGNGYIHMAGVPLVNNKTDYYVFSSDGVMIATKHFEKSSFVRFITLPNGQIACDSRESTGSANEAGAGQYHHKVELIDTQTGEESVLFEYDELDKEGKNRIQAVNVFDDDRLVYADSEGVYFSDYSFADSRKIYSWRDQAISVPYIYDVSSDENGTISMLINRDGSLYLHHLVPKPENVQEIELAVSWGADAYSEAVMEFNKHHPEYRIVVRDDYDETALLTRLIAGDGPVLVDSSLVPFAEHETLWEPLGQIYEESGIRDSLNSAALKLASIDGEVYGIVSDFVVETLITGADETDWDYDRFLQCIEKSSGLRYIMDNEMVNSAKVWIAIDIFDNGIENSFYMDAESGELKFDTEEFRTLLGLIDKYGPGQSLVPYVEGLRDGEVLCNFIYINSPRDLIFWRKTCGDYANIVGFPDNTGAKHRLVGAHVLAIRKTASDADKAIAAEFAKMLLSYEVQHKMTRSPNFHLSVRTDVLEEQIYSVKKGDQVAITHFGPEYLGFYLEEPDNEENGRVLKEILENSEVFHDEGYKGILAEEFYSYFMGEITEDMLIDHLNNRVGLYLEEQKSN